MGEAVCSSSSPAAGIPAAAASPPITSPHLEDSLNAICSHHTVLRILDDWFHNAHPVAPTVHVSQFMQHVHDGRATRDQEFCSLVISFCASTVATLPRKARDRYPEVTVKKCYIHGSPFLRPPPGSWDKGERGSASAEPRRDFTYEWCLAKYNFSTSTMASGGMDNALGMLLLNEAGVGVRHILSYSISMLSRVEQEMVKRLYSLIFLANATVDLFSRPATMTFGPGDNDLRHLLPAELPDDALLAEATTWPSRLTAPTPVTFVPGLNHLSSLFHIWHRTRLRQSCGLLTPDYLREQIQSTRVILDNLPVSLRWRGRLSRPPSSTFGHDVQMANLYITALHIRSNLLELGSKLFFTLPAFSEAATAAEHQLIVEDLLEILSHMPTDVFEANGPSIVPKARDMGAALHTDGSCAGTLEKLRELLKAVGALDFWPAGGSMAVS
ncbi:uncharacterized protein MKZ38_004767 [Zalerion maritima]|uniref:Uncharacterized protein n=1 Tax=Zalerion maritima TaxID=339359 RepID=A0AAD5RKX2_9PEZI|nr:uncharacterized protein MKZ38_004767 [Zalerion maritima]